MKRIVDVIVSLFGLIVLAPLFLVVSVLIKLDSPGPVFFRQRRVGLHGRSFRIIKFRTMVQDAHKMGSRLTTRRDPRVTRVGQILRWFKIDELPQLVNVLIGEMSLIGPRPEDPHFVEFYSREQRRVLTVRPGMLGPSQIIGRDELESYPEGLKDTEAYYVQHILPEKLERDLAYVATQSFTGDMRLLAHGLWVVLRGGVKARALWRWRWRFALWAVDCLLIVASTVLAYLLREDFVWPRNPGFLLLPVLTVLIVRSLALMYAGAYQGLFAYFGMVELVAIFKAVTVSAVVSAGLTFFVGLQSFPRSVFVIDWVLILLVLSAVRYALRGLARRRKRLKGHRRQKALIVGAGIGGEQIARTLLEDPLSPYRPVGFIDEQPERWGALIHGVRVVGGVSELPLTLSANGVKTVFVCMSDVSENAAREVVEMCDKARTDYRIVPTLTDLLSMHSGGGNGFGTSVDVRGNGHHANGKAAASPAAAKPA